MWYYGCHCRKFKRYGLFHDANAYLFNRSLFVPCYLDIYSLPNESFSLCSLYFLSNFMDFDIKCSNDLLLKSKKTCFCKNQLIKLIFMQKKRKPFDFHYCFFKAVPKCKAI